ncbi:MAG: glycosyltransferase [Saprospiraceae bacterium]
MKIILGILVFLLLHAYVLYPALVRWWAKGKKGNEQRYSPGDSDLPYVTVLMSVYNEEQVIQDKMESLLALDYPREKLRFYIGSDCSDDATNERIEAFCKRDSRIAFFPFSDRRGKPPVINELAASAVESWEAKPDHVFLLTDASVMMEPDVVFQLTQHFKNPRIGVVDANMQNIGLKKEGISQSEQQYIGVEVALKNAEGRLWGKLMGPFGGCYALRSDLFEPVPPNSLVDDFYLVFRVLEKGFMAINELNAVCREGATHQIKDEFRRKKRIAAGSFQNLMRFKSWVLPPVSTLGFAFFSHKVLRWFGGFILIGIWLCLAFLAGANQFYFWLFLLCTAGVPVLFFAQFVLVRLGINLKILKHVNYFLAMNLALIAGFFKWMNGIKTNTWQRTTRY